MIVDIFIITVHLVELVLGEPAIRRMVFGVNSDLVNRVDEGCEVDNFGRMRTFNMIGVVESGKWVAYFYVHAKFFENLTLEATNDIFAKIYMSARNLVDARQELFGVGAFRQENLSYAVKFVMNKGTSSDYLLAVSCYFAVVGDFVHVSSITDTYVR